MVFRMSHSTHYNEAGGGGAEIKEQTFGAGDASLLLM